MQSLKLPRNDTKSATTTTKSILKHLHLKTFTLHHHHQHQQQHHDNHHHQHHLPTNKDNKSEITCLVLTEDVVCVKYVCFQCQFYGISNVAYEAAARRRKRRELGMARTLVPADDAGAAVKELLTSPSKAQPGSPPKPSSRNDLSYHMELARRGLDQASNANAMANRRRAQTASPKHVKESSSPPSGSSNSKAAGPVLQKVSRRCDTVAIGELRKQRTDEVNRKLNERTRSDLAEIIKIAEIANDCSESAANAISDLTKTMNRLRTSQERDAATEEANRCSPGKHTTFHQEERIYYEPDPLEHIDQNGSELQERSKLGGILRSQRMLKARSIERESSFEPPKLSPILRRKSTDDPLSNAPHQSGNQIVSILKKKDHLSACESSSASSNASPVTFSANVMDTPSKQKRAGILKKRSSLDESRYYSRSHSPDERSIFIKSARRNSLEETAANGNMSGNCSLTQGPHGILKQSSYDSFKSDSCPSAGGAVGGGSSGESQHPHSILKKKDSTSTPSDLAQHATKHVSISQAVILAAAELSANETAENVTFGDDVSFTPSNEEYDIKPILKLETSTTEDSVRQPKPILKKKSSGDSDEHEIKPILKTSRKSSREEFEFDPFSESDSTSHGEPLVKPILKTDSPSKRRSLGPTDDDPDAERESATSPFMLKRRTRSLERQDHTPVIDLGAALNAIATSQENTDDLVASLTSSTPGANVSVADRIKSMEKFLTNQNAATAGSNSAINTSWESPLQNDPNKSEDVATAGGMAAAGAGAVKILKPSVIRRDLLKDRYKTQPVTSDEKNFFKSNDSSTLYTSPAGSAFKPAKSLEGLGFINITAHGNQSPNAPPSAFALTRSYTQPLQPLKHSLSNAAVVTSTSTPPPTAGQASTSFKARKTPTRNDSTTNQSDLTHSFTGDSGLSCDSNSEQRIFEMSGLEQDVDMIENQEPKTPSNTADVSSGGSSSGSGIVRTNSVRARANMFQQLQEKTNNGSNNGLNREERTSPRRVPRRLSPSPAANADEPRTPNNPPLNPDEEIASSSTVATATSSAFEPPRGILKSKSSVIGGVGLMPSALSNELKNRLKSSQNASVSNLRKSATTSDAVRELQPSTNISASTTSAAFPMTSSGLVASSSNQHDDTVSLVRNLTNLGKPPQLRDPMKTEPDIASASEGESSGGREVSEIIKNSAVARRRKFNEGNFLPKSKSHSSIVVPPPGGVAIGIGPQLPPLTGAIKLRHVGSTGDATKPDSLNSSLPPQLPSLSQFPKQQPQPSSSASASQDLPEEQFRQPTALPPFLQGGLRRSSTQVMGPDQRSLTITKTGSIADRLAALQKSGEDDWKRRISKRDEIDDIKRENFVNESISLAHDISDKPLAPSPFIKTAIEGGKVSDRLGKLKSSSESWKTRVEQSDASKFTVAGRLQKKAQSPVELQFERSANAAAKKCPLHVIRSANQPLLGLAKSPSMMTTGSGRTPGVGVGHHLVQRSLSINEGNVIAERSSSSNSDSDNEKDNKNKQNGNSKDVLSITVGGITSSHGAGTGGARVAIPKLDDEETFEKFFALKKSPTTPVTPEDESINIEDFDHIKSTQRLAVKRNIQLPKGRRAARNPLRNLASRTDLSSEYTEVKSGIAEREMRRIRAESYGGRANLAAEAIAGLASVEDFKSVSLKSSSLPLVQMWVPYKPVMLLHVKGRTHVQTRLVEPSYLSLNRGDCFILVNGPNLYRYVGSYANIIEISRSKKICAYIVENKDMGCTATSEVILTDGKFMNEHHWKKFWEILGKPEDYIIPDSGHADEDDLFEASLIETNKVYEFQDDSLVPFEKYWGCIPKVEMLDSKKVLVFDFGSEMYIWNGKNAPSDFKRAALKLAQEHYDDALVDYSKCYVNPMQYASIVGARDNYSFPKRCDKRGDWCILGKITQNMETSLFKEKFADWPEVERGDLEKDYLTNGVNSVKPLDGNALFKGNPYEEPNLVLEQANLGRGNFYYDTNSMRHFEIISKTCDKWQINEFNFDKVDSESYGHFYTAESYIIKWIYQINVTVRELSGRISNRSTVGRDRCVYFTWQGSEATANEKGAAALLTVELDKEKGAQMRVAQGDETTVFIRLFGVMCQHKGRREESLARRSQWRLYQVIGNVPEETLLKEVDCHGKQLRSRSSMLMIHGEKGIIYVWHGCQSAAHTRDVCQKAAEKLKDLKPKDLFESDSSVTIEVMEETKEVEDFKEILSGDFTQPAQLYGSLCDETAKFYNYTPRLFHFSSTQGVFSASELLSPLRCQDLITPYPFAQAQLYNARQPTIFMLDDGDSVWLWMGWWPLEDIKINTDERSSPTNENRAGVNRWISERRAALETAVSYWKAKFGENNEKQFHGIKGYVVWAGLEPIAFKALFPDWSDRDDIKDINLQDGRTNEPLPIADVLEQLLQTEYPLEVLKARPLPEGVDPTRLELYLNTDDFEKALGLQRSEFEQMPLWKQTNLKKERGLF
ncbi:supervillin isoform X9 [Musca domestica]|uniref:Supervillin isoform X9 n=1 Tax=Musca domestica TaxID=7370 RepID=A0A9J7D4W6_MUSDO|nr:supervillin isoform X9 [Musca domestica]